MKNRLFLTLSLMIAGFALSIAASVNAQISPNNQYTVRRPTKVLLPCQAANKDAAFGLYVTNNTTTAIPVNTAVYYSTNAPSSGSVQTSSVISPGQFGKFWTSPQAATTCQAWIYR